MERASDMPSSMRIYGRRTKKFPALIGPSKGTNKEISDFIDHFQDLFFLKDSVSSPEFVISDFRLGFSVYSNIPPGRIFGHNS